MVNGVNLQSLFLLVVLLTDILLAKGLSRLRNGVGLQCIVWSLKKESEEKF
jgi:hypothetical protein